MNKIYLLTTNHPSYEALKEQNVLIYDGSKNLASIDKDSLVFDFTNLNSSEKISLLKNIDAPIISDLYAFNVKNLMKDIPNLKGAFNLSIRGKGAAVEVFCEDQFKKTVQETLDTLKLEPLFLNEAPEFFIFPRTLSLIINEAYFALEEELASKEDIDNAMKYGVNYPCGPFQWAKDIGEEKISLILQEMYQDFKDERYKPAPGLS